LLHAVQRQPALLLQLRRLLLRQARLLIERSDVLRDALLLLTDALPLNRLRQALLRPFVPSSRLNLPPLLLRALFLRPVVLLLSALERFPIWRRLRVLRLRLMVCALLRFGLRRRLGFAFGCGGCFSSCGGGGFSGSGGLAFCCG
jgi:hypothetical protein